MPWKLQIERAAATAFAVMALMLLAGHDAQAQSTSNVPQSRNLPSPPAEDDEDRNSRLLTNRIRYDRDIRPILSDRCFKCHGPDSASRQADLRLDVSHSSAGNDDDSQVIVPGDPTESEVYSRVTSEDDEDRMPPPGSNKRSLSADERELIRLWIEQGAQYEPHWSFVPITRPAIPQVRKESWSDNPIDRFILAKLEQEGIDPSAEVDRLTWVRRIFLDVTGLPPTPAELEALAATTSEANVEQILEQLFHSEPYRTRYAEHMASRWLDAARYADTNGIHTDAGRQMWAWRDWVLEAYRNNMPFDRFVVDQLAGDLIADATLEQRIASGFNRNHVMTDEGGAINEEYLVEYAVDRTATTGSVLLGLTLGCARCHEHKFDPISQEEFYSLYAFFNSQEEPGLYSQMPDPNRAFEPFLSVPSSNQQMELHRLDEQLIAAGRGLETIDPAEAALEQAFLAETAEKARWGSVPADVLSAFSEHGATLTISPERSIVASGENPSFDIHTITLRTLETNVNLISLEALTHSSLPEGRIGRANNGNAVLSGFTAEAISVADPTKKQRLTFRWAWADREQANGDFVVLNAIDQNQQSGWAVAGHLVPGGRVALFLSDAPFGFEGGTDVVIRLEYQSIYAQHALGHIRLSLGQLDQSFAEQLPPAVSGWYLAGPFDTGATELPYELQYGPENESTIELGKTFGEAQRTWQHNLDLKDATLNKLASGTNVNYVGRRIYLATDRNIKVAVGSDDGFELFLNGRSIKQRQIERSLAENQDSIDVPLVAGPNLLVLKIVNTGGDAGFYFRNEPSETQWPTDLVLALLPRAALVPEAIAQLKVAWRIHYSPAYRTRQQEIAALEQQKLAINKNVPLTMVMRELPEPRPTYVLTRGVYDKPDMDRPVERNIPTALGAWPANAPRDRLGLATWMTSPENPLVARVAVNRLWEHFFGTGLVRTSEDFGMQGDWPSHPELLDWLAVELRDSSWDVQHIIRLMVSSKTYRQESRLRPEIHDRDPDNRWLAYFPRRRLTAEQIRDQALYVSGLLVEKMGGPSVKSYQPEGIWAEVAMLQSNTRNYERGQGDDLWRRSLYNYWKRACPPPSMSIFDAPTRESCTIRRSSTNTPLQALVLWNDPQFVEAARVLAARTLAESEDEPQRLRMIFLRCTGREPDSDELVRLTSALAEFRVRYQSSEEDANRLLMVGEAPRPANVAPVELAAWTMLASAIFNLTETLVID